MVITKIWVTPNDQICLLVTDWSWADFMMKLWGEGKIREEKC